MELFTYYLMGMLQGISFTLLILFALYLWTDNKQIKKNREFENQELLKDKLFEEQEKEHELFKGENIC